MVLSCRCHTTWSSFTLQHNKCNSTVDSRNLPAGAVASNGASFHPSGSSLRGVVMCTPNLLRLTSNTGHAEDIFFCQDLYTN